MKKGQSAMEFLMTYGWALMIILVLIGALAYFGILKASNTLPERCLFSPEIGCLEQKASIDGILKFRIKNNLGTNAGFSFNATTLGAATQEVNCTRVLNLPHESEAEVICPGFTFAIQGEKTRFAIKATYQKMGSSYINRVDGEILATIQ